MVGGFEEEIPEYGDFDFVARSVAHGATLVFAPTPSPGIRRGIGRSRSCARSGSTAAGMRPRKAVRDEFRLASGCAHGFPYSRLCAHDDGGAGRTAQTVSGSGRMAFHLRAWRRLGRCHSSIWSCHTSVRARSSWVGTTDAGCVRKTKARPHPTLRCGFAGTNENA